MADQEGALSPEEVRRKRLARLGIQTSTPTVTVPPESLAEAPVASPPAEEKARRRAAVEAKWESDMVGRIFGVTAEPSLAGSARSSPHSPASGRSSSSSTPGNLSLPLYLPPLVEALAPSMPMSDDFDGTDSLFHAGAIDRIIAITLGALPPRVSRFEYLVGCYARTQREEKKITKSQQEVSALAKDLIVSYAGLALKYPDMFPGPDEEVELGARLLLPWINGDGNRSLPSGFFRDLTARFSDDGLDALLLPVLLEAQARVGGLSLLDTAIYIPLLRSLGAIASQKATAFLVCQTPQWLRGRTGKEIELQSFLGPFFALSSINDTKIVGSPTSVFSRHVIKTRRDEERAKDDLRTRLKAVQGALFDVVKAVIKSNKDGGSMDLVLEWFARVAELNVARTKMRVNVSDCSSDGFLLNVITVALQLCAPFVNPGSNKRHLVDATYFLLTARIDTSKETKLAATSGETAAWVDKRNFAKQQQWRDKMARLRAAAGEGTSDGAAGAAAAAQSEQDFGSEAKNFNFITESFFLTSRLLHVGLEQAIKQHQTIMRNLQTVDGDRKFLQQTQAQWMGTPRAAMNQAELQRLDDQFHALLESKSSFETALQEPTLLENATRFYLFTCAWLTDVMDPEGRGLPLPPVPPMVFATLPEHIVSNVAQFLSYVVHYDPTLALANPVDTLMTFVLYAISSPAYVTNPYLRAKLIALLAAMVPRNDAASSSASFAMLFERHAMAKEHLASLLVGFYVDIEHTGSHTQFYDKFTPRHDIATLLEYLWGMPAYRAAMALVSQDETRWPSFTNMLLNDTIFTLDESTIKLREIRAIEQLKADPEAWAALSGEEQTERDNELRQAENRVRSWMALANESIHMLQYLTAEIVEPFMRRELLDQLVPMLDLLVVNLCSSKGLEVKVSNPERVGFRPRYLLAEIAKTMLHFKGQEAFYAAVVRDERSYSDEVFQKMVRILQREALLPRGEIAALEALVADVAAAAASSVSLEDILGDIPAEFEDAMLFTLMTDPVTLPSRNVVDRSTIVRHLLSDPTDPFTREPLTTDDLVPNDELRARIEAFIADKRAAYAARQQDAAADDGQGAE